MRISWRTLALTVAALLVLSLLVFSLVGRQNDTVPLTFTGPGEFLEGATGTVTCSTTTPKTLRHISIGTVEIEGTLAKDSDPDPKVVARVFTPKEGGKSRRESFNCHVEDVDGNTNSRTLTILTRDQQAPTWNGPIPALPAAGADGGAPGKVGVPFEVTIDAKDNGGAGVRGFESGIYVLSLTKALGGISVTDGVWTDPDAVPPGHPYTGGVSGELERDHTFTAQCTEAGEAVLNANALDAAGKDINHTLRVECYDE